MTSSNQVPLKGRSLESILFLQELPLDIFEGATVYDLGCGESDLGFDLAIRGIHASVTGFDRHRKALFPPLSKRNLTQRRFANLEERLPVNDESAEVVLATYSLPHWADNPQQIAAFFLEATRVVAPGGILSIYPTFVHSGDVVECDYSQVVRQSAVNEQVGIIKDSGLWLPIELGNKASDRLTVQKLG